jgi:hypothetical protein
VDIVDSGKTAIPTTIWKTQIRQTRDFSDEQNANSINSTRRADRMSTLKNNWFQEVQTTGLAQRPSEMFLSQDFEEDENASSGGGELKAPVDAHSERNYSRDACTTDIVSRSSFAHTVM